MVAGVWCEVLDVPAVGPDDDFFDLGGDSFKVVAVVGALRERLALDIPLAALLHEPTPAGFTAELRRIAAEQERADRETPGHAHTDHEHTDQEPSR